MSTKTQSMSNEFICPECKEMLPLGTKNCKWCGAYIPNPPTTPVPTTPEKNSFFSKVFKKS